MVVALLTLGVVRPAGLEPATQRVETSRSNPAELRAVDFFKQLTAYERKKHLSVPKLYQVHDEFQQAISAMQ